MINVSTCENGLPAFTLAEKIVLSTWYGLAGMAAMTGNAVVLCLIYRIPSLRTTSNFFISSLAVADLLVGLVIAPVWIVLRCWYTDVQNYGEAIDFLWIHTTVATTFNLLCVSLDRNVAIFYPLRYQNILSKRRCFSAIAIVWLVSLCLPFWRFLVDDSSGNLALWMSVSVITILVPMIIILLCSARILKATNRQLNRIIYINSLPHNQAEVKRAKTNTKASKTLFIIVGLFVVSWLPSLVTSFVNYFTQSGYCGLLSYYNTVWLWVEAVAFTSSGINPWVYCLRNNEFYQHLSRHFGWNRNRIQPKPCTPSNVGISNGGGCEEVSAV